MPDPAIGKDHPPDVDYGAKVEPKHKAFILYTILYIDDEYVVSLVLIVKFKIYIPVKAIKEYNEKAQQAALAAG